MALVSLGANTVRDSGVLADGVVLGAADGHPFCLAYEVRCDAYWRVWAARVGINSVEEAPLVNEHSLTFLCTFSRTSTIGSGKGHNEGSGVGRAA